MEAKRYVGIPYNMNGNSVKEGFNCWTFVKHFIKEELGIELEWSPDSKDLANFKVCARLIEQGSGSNTFVDVDVQELKPGDLVLMGKGSRYCHIGVYIGGNNVVHCQNIGTGGQVMIWPMRIVNREYRLVRGLSHVVQR